MEVVWENSNKDHSYVKETLVNIIEYTSVLVFSFREIARISLKKCYA